MTPNVLTARMSKEQSALWVIVAFFVLLYGSGLIGDLIANGFFVFNFSLNDSAVGSTLLVPFEVIGLYYLFMLWKHKKSSTVVTHALMGLWLATYLSQYVTYFFDLPSNDFLRIVGIVMIPFIIVVWRWALQVARVTSAPSQ